MKSYKSILLLLLLGASLSVFADADPEPASYRRSSGRNNYHASHYRGHARRSTSTYRSAQSIDGWGFGASVNEYFGDFEYFGDLVPVYEMTAADWKKFGKGIGRQMGAGVHATYNMYVNNVIDFRASASFNWFHGTHYEYAPTVSSSGRVGQNDMSGAKFWSLGLGIHDGIEIYPRRDAAGFFFYVGAAAMFTIQSPTIKDEKFHAFGISPMIDLGIGYKWGLPRGGDVHLDFTYSVALLDYACSKAISGGTWGFNSSLDGYPGKYVKSGVSPEAFYSVGNVDNSNVFACWYQEIRDAKGNLVENRFRWPDSYLKLALTFSLPQMKTRGRTRTHTR